MRNQNSDPSSRKLRKTIIRGTAVAVAAGLTFAAITDGKDPNVAKTSFASYGQAKARLGKLASAHGNESGSTTKKTEAVINGSLEAAAPLFVEHVASTMSELASQHNGGYKLAKDGVSYGFDFNSFTDNNEQRIDVLNGGDGDGSVYLAVTYKKDGTKDVLYRKSSRVLDETLTLSGTKIDSSIVPDFDANPNTSTDYRDVTVVHFNGHGFNESEDSSKYAGSDLEVVNDRMRDIDNLLVVATEAATAGTKDY